MSPFKLLILFSVYLALSACGGGGSGAVAPIENEPIATTVNISGGAQKGPFIVGSEITINTLTASGVSTGSTFVTQTTNDLGDFVFETEADELVQISSNGYYRNEITGVVSSGPLTLRSIYKTSSAGTQQTYVNLLTHIAAARVLTLIRDEGATYESAVSQAESELLLAFGTVIPNSAEFDFNTLSIFSEDAVGGSPYLLALSAIVSQHAITRAGNNSTSPAAELAILVNEYEADFSSDGVIDMSLMPLRDEISGLDPSQIMANLAAWVDGDPAYAAADINIFLDTDLDGIFNSTDADDDNDGVQDDNDLLPYEPNFSVVDLFVTTNEDTSVVIDVSANDPLTLPVLATLTATASHGAVTGVYPNMTYTPTAHYAGVDEFGYRLSSGTLLSDPVTVNLTVMPVADTPIIDGMPETEIEALSEYSFTPTVINFDNTSLVFSIENAPSWSNFNQSTGQLSGTPTNADVDIYEDIVISVTSGNLSASMDSFSITVFNRPWIEVEPMFYGRHYFAPAVSGSTIYVTGSRSFDHSRADAEAYDSLTDTWQIITPMIRTRDLHTAHAIGNKVIVIGGGGDLILPDPVIPSESYDIASDTWSLISSPIEPRMAHASCAYDGKIFVFGGDERTNLLATVEMYDPETDTWTSKAPMDRAAINMECVVLNDRMYLFNGSLNYGIYGDSEFDGEYRVYNPILDVWEDNGTLEIPRRRFKVAATGGLIYFFGGVTMCGESVCEDSDEKLVYAFDPATSTMTPKTPMPLRVVAYEVAAANDKIYILAGFWPGNGESNTYGDNGGNQVLRYDPVVDSN